MANSFPIIKTPHLILNQLQIEDVPLITINAQNKNIEKFLISLPDPYLESHAVFWVNQCKNKFQEGSQFNFAIREKTNADFIGTISLILDKQHQKANIGYWLAEQFWNKGFMTQSLKAVIDFAFVELKLNKVFASHYPENKASGIIMQKAGMEKEGVLKEELFKNGVYYDSVRYGLIARNYFNMD